MTQSTLCCSIAGGYCRRCDVLVGLPGVRVVDAVRDESGALTVTVESELDWTGCYLTWLMFGVFGVGGGVG